MQFAINSRPLKAVALSALLMLGLFCFIVPGRVAAAPILDSSTTFSPADVTRDHMDRGGVWDGSAEVTATTGDTFRFTVCNVAAGNNNTAFDLAAAVTLPAGFSYVTGTAAGVTGITASQTGTLLTFGVPADTDLSTTTCRTVSFGLTAATTVNAGIYPLAYEVYYSTTDGGMQYSTTFGQDVLVESGAGIIVKGAANQLKAVGDTVNWTITVTNMGGGGMFGVGIDESIINPGPGLALGAMTQTAPASPAATAGTASLTLPYLAPGEQFVASVSAVVTGCSDLNNTAYLDDRTHISSGSASTQVLLDFRTPLINFTAPAITLNNLVVTPVSVAITNTGRGAASGVVLGTTFASFPVTVSNVAAGWAYDAASGSFTKTSDGGVIANSGADTLTFDIAPSAGYNCTPPADGLYFLTGTYSDVCGNPYANPVKYGSLAYSYTRPSLTLGRSMPGHIVTPASDVNASISLSVTRPDLLATDPLVVVDTLPANVSALVLGTPTGGSAVCPGGTCDPGEAVTWTIPNPYGAATVNYTLPFTFSVSTITCADRQSVTNTAVITATSTTGCSFSSSVYGTSLLTNTVSTSAYTGYTQAYAIASGVHETGLPDDGDGVREVGEGAFITIASTYGFPAAFVGTWTGTTYRDDYGEAADMTLVPGSLTVSWDGGAPVAVPQASITQTTGTLAFSAAFLQEAGYLGGDSVAGHSLSFNYSVTAPDSVLGSGGTASLSHFSDLEVGGGATGACDSGSLTRVIQYATSSLARASAALLLAMPSVIDVCETFTATTTFTGSNFSAYGSSFTLPTAGNYTFPSAQTPVYGGSFNPGNITYAANSGVNPSFAFSAGGLLGSGTAGVQLRRKAATGTANAAIAVSGEYDDWQTAPAAARDFAASASASPELTRVGRMVLTTTPQAISITGSQVEWVIYVNNSGSGGLYNVAVNNIVPDGLTINVSSTNALNPDYPVTVTGSTAAWNVTSLAAPIDIAAGGGIALSVVADVAGTSCSIEPGSYRIPATWGCDGTAQETITKTNLNFTFPSGSIQATHDRVNTFAKLCSTDYDTIIVRNTGLSHLYGAKAYEVLESASTGITLVSGSVEVSTNSGSTWSAPGVSADPAGSGTTADPYLWTSAQVPQLADIAPFGDSGSYSSVRLRFKVAASETTNGLQPQVTAGASGSRACGQALSDAGTPFTVTVKKPNITVVKTGRNVTAGDAAYSDIVYGGEGDEIEWRTVVQNNGIYQAEHLRFVDLLATDGGSATVSGPGITGTPALTSNYPVRVSTLAAAGSATYVVTEVLGGTCVSQTNASNVSWGCTENAEGLRSNLSAPATSTDTAGLVMVPDFVNASSTITFSALSGGRAQAVLHFVNTGGTAQNIVVISSIPAGMQLDDHTPVYATNGGVTGMAVAGTLAAPRFTFTGVLRNAKYLDITYRVIQTGDFDVNTSSYVVPETTAAGTDPELPAGGTVTGEVAFDSTCGDPGRQTLAGVLAPATPDVDMTVSPASVVVDTASPQTFDFTLTNNGDTGSTADNVSWSVADIGSGWTGVSVTVLTPGTGGTGGACGGAPLYSCTASQLGTLAAGESAVVRLTATAGDNGGDLALLGQAAGRLYTDGGADGGGNYSLDKAAPKVVGMTLTKSLVATSETFTSSTTLAIGEEATFRLRARWFGGAAISAVTLRDTLPAGLGFVSVSTTASHDLSAVTVSNAGSVYDLGVDPFSGSGTLEADLVARALNTAYNTNGRVNVNSLGLSFIAEGVTYASSDATDAFGGTYATLHASTATAIARPALTLDKQVRGYLPTAGSYAQSGSGQAGYTMEYKVTLANSGSAPAFDISVVDVLATSKLVAIAGADDGIDNDGDGAAEDALEGFFYAVGGGSVTFNDANTGLAAGAGFARLDPGQQVTLTYLALIDAAASPNDALLNGATYYASSLAGASGSQTGTAGVPGASNGELQLSGTDTVSVLVSAISSFVKTLVTTSKGADVSTNVVVGEQAGFRLSLVLPAGTVTNFHVFDSLPSGLGLAMTPSPVLGSAISTVTYSVTPSPDTTSGGQHINWDFGTVTVSSNTTDAQRTVTIPYFTQVRNIAANIEGATLVNSSSYSYTGSLPVNSSSVTLGVKESSVSVSVAMSSTTASFDAGSVIIATVTLSDLAGRPTAYDANLVMTLPSYLTYVGGSLVSLTGTTLGEPDVFTSTLTWGRGQSAPFDIDIASGTNLKFQVSLLVGNTVLPGQIMPVTVRADWTSLNGAPGSDLGYALGTSGSVSGERTGNSLVAPDNYYRVGSGTMTVANVFSITKSSSPSSMADGSFRIGDQAKYTLRVTFQEGTVQNVRVQDTLPAGMAYDSLDSLTPASGGVFTYTAPTLAGSTGTLTWNFGTVLNTGNNDTADNTLTLVYNARVINSGLGTAIAAPSNPLGISSQTLVNAAIMRYTSYPATARNTVLRGSTVTVKQPLLTLGKTLASGQSSVVGESTSVGYQLTVRNAGTGSACDIQVKDILPDGMRAATPVMGTVLLNGSAITLTPAYNSSTGELQWDLDDTQVLFGASGSSYTLVMNYTAQTDAAIGGGLALVSTATVTQYFSKPASDTDAASRRTYAATASSAAAVTTPGPGAVSKSVSLSSAAVGSTLYYTITVPTAPLNVAIYNLRVQDVIPAGLAVASIGNNASSLAAGSCGSVSVTDNTSGNALDLTYNCLPAGAQAVITATAAVKDIAGNQAGTVLSNGASFTWAKTSGGTVQTAISTAGITTTLKEPVLSVDKTLVYITTASASQGLQAGDKVRYRVKVVNAPGANAAPAYDLALRDLADADLGAPTVIANPDNPGAAADEGTSGGVTSYRWNIAGPLAVGATYQFDVEFTLGAGVQPQQTLVNRSSVTWTSLGGAVSGERDGSGGVDDYLAYDATPVSVTAGSAHVEKIVKAPGVLVYAVGDLVTYRADFTFGQGVANGVHIIDALPSGLVFSSAAVSASNVQAYGGGPVAFVSGPSAGDTGSLNFSLGALESTGAGPDIALEITARVQDIGANINGHTLTNSVSAQVTSSTGGVLSVMPQNALPVITVMEPSLSFSKVLASGQSSVVGESSQVSYRATAVNSGPGVAYNVRVLDTLPEGMRLAAPVVTAATLDGAAITVHQVYDSVSGVVVWNLTDAQYIQGAVSGSTRSLVVDYYATTDAGLGGGLTLANAAYVLDYYSRPSSDTSERRMYASTASSSAIVTTPGPGAVSKTVSLSSAAIGSTLYYTITVPTAPLNVAIYDLRVQDAIPSGLTVASIGNNASSLAAGSCGSVSVTDNTSGNALDLTYNCLPPGAQAVITATAAVSDLLANQAGTVLNNGASFTWAKTSGGTVQTAISTAGITTTLKEPVLSVDKTLVYITTASASQGLQAGDKVRYRVKVVNAPGANAAPAYDLALRDLADADLGAPTVIANPDNPGAAADEGTSGGVTSYRWNIAGPLAVGATYQFDVEFTLGAGVQPQQTLVNRSSVTWTSLGGAVSGERDGSGGVDDYMAYDATPVALVVGPVHVAKSVKAPGLLTYTVGQLVTYRIEFSFGQGAVNNVHLLDVLPSGLEYSSAAVTASNARISGGGAVTVVSGPSAGATGTLDFSLGSLESTGSDPAVGLEVTARVLDIPANAAGTTLTNRVRAQLLTATGTVVYVEPETALPVITLLEPSLTSGKTLRSGQAAVVEAGSAVGYRITVVNSGAGAAYNIRVVDTLPAGMRQTVPVVGAATLDGVSVTLAQTYTAATGIVQWDLADGQYILGAVSGSTRSLVIDYDAYSDADAGGALTLTNSADVDRYYSQPGAATPERRQYAATASSAATVTTPAPSAVAKAVSVSSAAIGQIVVYTITAPAAPVNVALFDLRVQDAIPAGLTVSAIGNNASSLLAGSCGSVTAANNSSGNALDLTYNCLPPGAQAVIVATAAVRDIAGNQAGTVLNNGASFTWAKTSGGAAQTAISTAGITTTLKEPVLSVDKTLVYITTASASQGLQAGDKVRYRVKVVNASGADVSPAYNLALRDLADSDLISPSVTASPDNPGTPVNEGASGGLTAYRWDIAGPLAAGATYQFDVEFTLGTGVQPQQTLVNRSSITWTSLAGTVGGERDGSGGVDDYTAYDATPVAVMVAGQAHVEKSVKAPGDLTYAVGELVTYRVDFTFGRGTLAGVHILDSLPSGLEYSSATLTAYNAQRSGGGAAAVLSGPATGATGTLDFSLGALESLGADPALELDITARVQDVPANVAGASLTNGIGAQITSSTGGVLAIMPVSALPVIAVAEPRLAVALDAPSGGLVDYATPAQYTLRALNTGGSEAYQAGFQVQLSTTLRVTDPTGLAVSAAVSGGRTLALTRGTDYSVAYSTGAGTLSFLLLSSSAYIAAGETFSAAFYAAPDDNPVNGHVLYSTGAAVLYYSRDTSAGAPAGTRSYSFSLPAANGGLADGAALLGSDDHGDNAYVQVRAPVLGLVKAVTPYTAMLPADTTLNWTVAIYNNGPVDTLGAAFADDLGAFAPGSSYISSGTLSTVVVSSAPAGFTDASSATGGTNSRGRVTLSGLVIPAVSTVTVSFSVRISSAIPNQTKLYNRAVLTVPGFTAGILSDSSRAADNDGVEAGNAGGDPDDDDPTAVTINSNPGFDFQKTASDDNGGALVAGDTVTYTLVIRNRGTERATGSVVTDAMPANTVYLPGSTRLNGVAAADNGGISPLAAGLAVNSSGEAAGVLAVYSLTETANVSFRVVLSTSAAAGTRISNQAFLTGLGEGTGTPISRASDDPGTDPAPDPTDLVVSGGANLLCEKTVTPGTYVAAGDTVTYTITVRNLGDVDAASVVLADSQPVHAVYQPGSMSFDPDGTALAASYALTDAADGDSANFNLTSPGELTVAIGTIAANSQVSLSFRAVVDAAASSGTVVANQARISAAGLADIRSDGDGDHGNGNQPTYSVVGGSTAVLVQTKQVFDVDGGEVLPGDVLEYVITTYNIGASTAGAVTVTDSVPPAGTVYSTGTTRLDGVLLPDVSDVSALAAGYNVGDLVPGRSRLLRFRVVVATNAVSGSVITNQASFSSNSGAITGVSDSDLDDGVEGGNSSSDPNDDDPTRVQVGGAPGSAAINGVVWLDSDHDRAVSAGETREAGWTVELLHGGVLTATAVTGTDGAYRMANLTPGLGYQVRFRHPVTGSVFGRARSSKSGTVLTDGTIRGLALETGENLYDQNLPLDPNGVLYDAVTRLPLSGVPVYLDGPAGYDAATHLLPGQSGQVTGTDGLYQFDINFAGGAPFGVYTLRFAAPSNYITSLPGTPSSILPPAASSVLCTADNCLDVPLIPDPYQVQLQNTAPAGAQSTDYYLRFRFDSASDVAVVNNHVPVDPVLDSAIFVTKTVQKADVVRGELVLYTITARNTLSAALTSIKLRDLLPAGFKYREGSSTLNGTAAEPARSGRYLDWTGLTFAGSETKTFKLLLIVGAGVTEGRYVNQAWAVNTIVDARVSNVGAATVRVTADPLFDCSDVLGKVFEDTDTDGYQDNGERGLPNVRLATARGWTINTDQYGRFHIACADIPDEARGSNFIMKLDESTLPRGYRMTTENPRVARLTRGKTGEIEFGAAPYRAVRLDISSAAFIVKDECVPSSVERRSVWDSVLYTPPIPPLRFDNAKFEVTPEHVAMIRGVVEKVRSMPDIRNIKVKVTGHTDSSPIVGRLAQTIADNWVLSRSRATRVGALLLEKLPDMIKPDMIVPEGRADTEPLVPNATPEGKALNRRVQVDISYERPVERFVEVPVSGNCSSCLPAHRTLETDWTVLVDSGNVPPIHFSGTDPDVTLEQAAMAHNEMNRVGALPGIRNVKLKLVGRALAADGDVEPARAAAERAGGQLLAKMAGNPGKDLLIAEGQGAQGGAAPAAQDRFVEVQVAYEHPEPRVVEVPASGNCASYKEERAAKAEARMPWRAAVERVLAELERAPGVLRLGYCRAAGEKIEEARFRVWKVSEEIRARWASVPGRYTLVIENDFDGAACAGGRR